MSQIWQEKLSSLEVAPFPWDPPQESTPPHTQSQSQQQLNPVPPAASTSNAPRPPSSQQHGPSQQLPQPISGATSPVSGSIPTAASAANANGQPQRIKLESGINGQSGLPAMGAIPPSSNLARERAANMLHHKFGPAAANSVLQLQAQSHAALSLPGQQRLQNAHLPNGQVSEVKTPQSYQNPQQVQRTSVSNSQTDGADETMVQWKAEVAQRREASRRQNGHGDRLLREHITLQALRLESGGLMRPLDQHHHLMGKGGFSSNLSGVPDAACQLRSVSSAVTSLPNRSILSRSQCDGLNDDGKTEDEDAINSDLDDPDDLVAEEHDSEDAVGQVMLCTYDKVQRVKNKWKCTLKDGILTTGGKE